MNIGELNSLYENCNSIILNKEALADLCNTAVEMCCYSFKNRVLIYAQNKYSKNARVAEYWDISGRAVNDKASPIWICHNIEKASYVDPLSGADFDIEDLTLLELDLAVQLGIVKKKVDVTGEKCIPLYDITSTHIVNEDEYNKYKDEHCYKPDFNTIIKTLKQLYGVRCTRSNTTSSFDRETNSLRLVAVAGSGKISALADCIIYNCGTTEEIENMECDTEVKEYMLRMNNLFSSKILVSFGQGSVDVDSKCFEEIDLALSKYAEHSNKLIKTLENTYNALCDIIYHVKPYEYSYTKLRKASEYTAVLEAADRFLKLR